MIIIILISWLISISLILIFFKGATKKEKEMENKANIVKNNINSKVEP